MQFINFGFNFVVMLKSVLLKSKRIALTVTIIFIVTVNYCFKYNFNEQDWLSYANRCLSESYDPSGDAKLKKWELSVNSEAFVRLRKTYAKGKQEYYSFNLHQFNELDYLGNTITGSLELKTTADDIIVQTHNDPHGDVDSMATVLNIPVKNMEPERLDSLREALNFLGAKGL
ncbi:MAG: hypothetical protein JWQ84_766 [Mucilaginibacter sp.]|nr:hypothetical protein [Mucilaginibacter sp.]